MTSAPEGAEPDAAAPAAEVEANRSASAAGRRGRTPRPASTTQRRRGGRTAGRPPGARRATIARDHGHHGHLQGRARRPSASSAWGTSLAGSNGTHQRCGSSWPVAAQPDEHERDHGQRPAAAPMTRADPDPRPAPSGPGTSKRTRVRSSQRSPPGARAGGPQAERQGDDHVADDHGREHQRGSAGRWRWPAGQRRRSARSPRSRRRPRCSWSAR